jgi:hypothetical protein
MKVNFNNRNQTGTDVTKIMLPGITVFSSGTKVLNSSFDIFLKCTIMSGTDVYLAVNIASANLSYTGHSPLKKAGIGEYGEPRTTKRKP